MVIDKSVQYNDAGFLPDIIHTVDPPRLLTTFPLGNPVKYHVLALYL